MEIGGTACYPFQERLGVQLFRCHATHHTHPFGSHGHHLVTDALHGDAMLATESRELPEEILVEHPAHPLLLLEKVGEVEQLPQLFLIILFLELRQQADTAFRFCLLLRDIAVNARIVEHRPFLEFASQDKTFERLTSAQCHIHLS